MGDAVDKLQVFVIDLNDPSIGFVVVQANTVYNIEGDLIFANAEGDAIDMIARGQWKRCKVRYE